MNTVENESLISGLSTLRQQQRQHPPAVNLKPSKVGVLEYVFSPPLYILNWRAGIWHLLLSVLMILLAIARNPPFSLELNRSWSTVNTSKLPAFLKNDTCCIPATSSNCKVYDDVYEWFDCLRPSVEQWQGERIENENDVPLYEPSLTQLTEPIPLISLIIVFELFTSACHFWIYTQDGGKLCSNVRGVNREYTKLLLDQLNPYRWLEYAVTASIMLLSSLALSRVSDIFLLTSLFINSFFLNFVGGNCFELLYLGQRNLTKHADWFRTIKWIAFGSSWLCFIANLATFWDAYISIVSPYLKMDKVGGLWEQLFYAVTWANLAITIDFCAFPAIHMYQFAWPHGKHSDEVKAYMRGEAAYIWASFVSKTMLTGIIGTAALMRRDSS